jgi:ketosteroid isomerase-like protein
MSNGGSEACLLGLGVLFSAIGVTQTVAIDPAARKDIDAGNQGAMDCTPTGECVKGRAAIEDSMRGRIARLDRAICASATSLGSVQQGDFVYEWGRSEVSFANGQKVAHRYLTVWQRQPGGAWKIFRNMPIPDDARR